MPGLYVVLSDDMHGKVMACNGATCSVKLDNGMQQRVDRKAEGRRGLWCFGAG